MRPFRFLYHRFRKRKLSNQSFSIISSDCFGSFIYHDMGLKFYSPTINLLFAKEDFWTFLGDLEGFLSSDVEEIEDPTVAYPKGEIYCGGKSVTLNFMHYKSFDEARAKWNERKQRVDFQNLYILQTITHSTQTDIETFEKLPFAHKLLLTDQNPSNSEHIVTHPVFSKKDYTQGKVLTYKSPFSLKRYIDDIDYITFLNKHL